MKFYVKDGVPSRNQEPLTVFLVKDNWDDWFKYNTTYSLYVFDEESKRHHIGSVKIGQFKMEGRRADTPSSFDDEIGEEFFSLGQDDSYYENLNFLGADIRDGVLLGLRDVAANTELFEKALAEDVMGVSLLRSVTPSTVRGQFRRLANGGARLSSFNFSYAMPPSSKKELAQQCLEFSVNPESNPPSNIHVLIGRNGVGKTTILNQMADALASEVPADTSGKFQIDSDCDDENTIANLVSVAFSAFDPFEPIPMTQNKSKGIQYSYIGLKRQRKAGEEGKQIAPKNPSSLSREFSQSYKACRQGAKYSRLKHVLEILESDPIFQEAEIATLGNYEDDSFQKLSLNIFGKLSSGHKIVLLTITKLIETVEERTLVLIDEPEAHLHPPLLSAFVRALCWLLTNRNGIAIIATHSPVVLQEVPSSCVWKIRRSGRKVSVERPDIETFGENVGTLTREVFGLEVTNSGFHKLLKDSIQNGDDFEEVFERFEGKLGGEARALLMALILAGGYDVAPS